MGTVQIVIFGVMPKMRARRGHWLGIYAQTRCCARFRQEFRKIPIDPVGRRCQAIRTRATPRGKCLILVRLAGFEPTTLGF